MTTESVVAAVGRSRVLVEAVDLAVPADVGEEGRYGTHKTSRDLRDAYAQLKDLIRDVADDMGGQLAAVSSLHGPDDFELEFGLCFSAQGNLWVLKTSGDVACRVKLTWHRTDRS